MRARLSICDILDNVNKLLLQPIRPLNDEMIMVIVMAMILASIEATYAVHCQKMYK